MKSQKIFIKNRKNQNVSVLLEITENQRGLAFVTHGLGGFKEQDHIQTFADAFKEEGFSVIRFDTTNTLGESDGKYEDATTTNYYEDLEDVIEWAKSQSWYEEPFWLVGHSLGGISIILFAEKYHHKVKALAPISTVVSGKLSMETKRYEGNDLLEQWKKTGWKEEESKSKPGFIKRLKWSHMEDRLKYNVLDGIDKLTMPVLLITGEDDDTTPPEHQQILFDNLPNGKQLHIIKNAPHTFREKEHLEEIRQILKKWINEISKPRIIIVDKNDKEIGFKVRGTLTQNDIYRVSALWITNSNGEILLARRHHTKSHHPRKWGPAVAGTVDEEENYEENIIKEAEEELGLKNINPQLGPKTETTGQYHHFTQWFTLTVDKDIDDFKIQEDEVEEIKWFPREELGKMLDEQPDEFLPTMKKYFNLFK